MIFIGNFALRLKKITTPLFAVFLIILIGLGSQGFAMDRELASSEVQKLEAILHKDPTSITSVKFLMKHYHEKGQWKDVIRIAQPVLKTLDQTYCNYLVDAYVGIKDGNSALTLVGHMLAKWKASADLKITESQVYVVLAETEKEEKRRMIHANKALEVLREGVQLDPKNEDVYMAWVDVLKKGFWPHYALDVLNVIKTMEEKIEDYETYNPLKCEYFVKASLWDQGSVACQRAIKANPRDVASHLNFAEVQSIKISADERKTLLKKISRDFPNSYEAQRTLADMFFSDRDFDSATAQYKKVLEIQKNDIDSMLRLAESEFQTKQFAAALVTYKKHCKSARMVASEFKEATKLLRSQRNLHTQYYEAMQSCR